MMIYEGVLKEFQRQKVDYLIVGGIAAYLLGSQKRMSGLEIIAKMTDKNCNKVVTILKDKGYKTDQVVKYKEFVGKKKNKEYVENSTIVPLNFYKRNELKDIDILVDYPVPFLKAKKTSVKRKVGDIALCIDTSSGYNENQFIISDHRRLRYMGLSPAKKLECMEKIMRFIVKYSPSLEKEVKRR